MVGLKSTRLLPFLAVEAATLLSGIGNGISMVALPWLVLELTGSATAAGTLAALTAIPTMAAALLSGTIVDVVGRRRVSITSDVLSLLAVAAIPVLDATVGLTFALILLAAVAGAIFDPAGMGAREAMVPESATHAGLSLPRANSIHEAVWGVAFLLGPGVGGLLIAWVGAAPTFWAAAAMFAVSVAVVSLVGIPGGGRPPEEDRPEGFWSGTGEGLAFIWADVPLRNISLLLMVLVAVYMPIEGVLLPYYFEGRGEPQALGLVLMLMSAGAIVGALAYGWLSGRFSQRGIFVWSMVLTSLAFLPIAVLPPLTVMLPFAVLFGFAYGPISPTINVAMQTRTPSRLRGRVIGVLTAVQYAAGPLGYLAAGPLVDRLGLGTAMIVMSLGLVVVAAAAIVTPGLRELDDHLEVERPLLDEAPPPRPL